MMPPDGAGIPPYVAGIRVRAGEEEMRGSGLVLGPSHILTCAHVVADAVPAEERAPLRASLDEPVASGWPVIGRGAAIEVLAGLRRAPASDWRHARYVAEDRRSDLALLQVDRPLHGVAPPLIGRHPPPQAWRRVAYGCQNERFFAGELRSESNVRFYFEGEARPHALAYVHGMPGGLSGGPKIAIDERGRHWLEGLCAVGGLATATGLDAGTGAIVAFLEKELPGWHPPDPREGTDAPPQPGVVGEFVLAGPGAGPIRFRRLGDAPAFRALRPLSAEAERRLRGAPDRTGGARLAAHLPDAGAARACLERLGRALGVDLRLPTLAELDALAATEPGEAPAAPAGRFVTLASFDAAAGLGLLPETAEWASDRTGAPRPVLRRPSGETTVWRADEAGHPSAHPHLRLALRPVYEPS